MVGNEANRNHIKDKFLKEQYDYLLMIDTDQEPVGNPLDMIKHDKDVVSMPTVINMGEKYVLEHLLMRIKMKIVQRVQLFIGQNVEKD